MARTTKAAAGVTVTFPRTGNPWIDAGVVGLHRVLLRKASYLVAVPDADRDDVPGSEAFPDVIADLAADGLTVAGPKAAVQACLERAYDVLIGCYYSVSSERQRTDTKGYNFFLDSGTEEFRTFPKKRAAGAALLMFDKAARPQGDQEKWAADPATGKKAVGRLPAQYADLQPKLDALLAETGIKPGPPAGLLVGGENAVRPKVKIAVGDKCKDEPDFLSGEPAAGPQAAKQTAFPLFGGSRAFQSGTTADPRLGWRTDFAGKFTPAVCFHYTQGEDIFLFLPSAADLTRTAAVADRLAGLTLGTDPNFYRNFELKLGGYFSGRVELTVAFLHRVFAELSRTRRAESSEVEFDDPDEEDGDDGPVPIEAEAVGEAVGRGGAVNFTVVAARKSGNVWAGREFAEFSDTLYLARLFGLMTEPHPDRPGRMRCEPRRLMRCLVDHAAAKNKSLLRDAVCGRVLRKQPVLDLLERHAHRVFGEWSPGQPRHLGPLLDFASLYQPALHEGDPVTKQTYDEMVKQAQRLGRDIATGVANAGRGASGESAGRSKGVFFRLRRTRKKEDFLTELGRLQSRYKIDVPDFVLDPAIFNSDSFAEYRGFCTIAALNKFQYLAGK